MMLLALPGCISMLEPPPAVPTASDDVGPKPVHAEAIALQYANRHYAPALTADEMVVSEPVPIVYHDLLLGRKVGWQVISGPENERFTRYMELQYTRFIIHNGDLISVVSQDFPFKAPQ
jgi:hypothetical protein